VSVVVISVLFKELPRHTPHTSGSKGGESREEGVMHKRFVSSRKDE